MTSLGMFIRYSIEEHRELFADWPEMNPILFRRTWEEASAAAREFLAEALIGGGNDAAVFPTTIEWIHHPENPAQPADPYNLVGSWGWKAGYA